MTFSERLIAERNRLDKNQADFGRIGGIVKKTQGEYENDHPPAFANYLEKIAAAGADILFIVTGQRNNEPVLTKEEKEMLALYRAASPELRTAATAVLKAQVVAGKAANVNVKGTNTGNISIKQG